MKRNRSLYPAPVIVASFRGGETIRLSFWQPAPRAGKPIIWRFDVAAQMARDIIGNERERALRWDGRGLAPQGMPAFDMTDCHIEWDGVRINDGAGLKRAA